MYLRRFVRAVLAMRVLSRTEVLLRLAALAGGLLALASIAVAGDLPQWGWLAGGVLVVGSACVPDSDVGILAVIAVLVLWFWRVSDPSTVWSVPAAAGMLLLHAGQAAVSSVAPGADLPRASVLRWARRSAAVVGLTALAWGIGWLFARVGARGDALLTAAALLSIAAGAFLLRREVAEERPPEAPTSMRVT